jgi:hypothetical protein
MAETIEYAASLARARSTGAHSRKYWLLPTGDQVLAHFARVCNVAARVNAADCLLLYRHTSTSDLSRRMAASISIASGALRADGDAELGSRGIESFVVPDCASCGGMLKPDVVFFGDVVPESRKQVRAK